MVTRLFYADTILGRRKLETVIEGEERSPSGGNVWIEQYYREKKKNSVGGSHKGQVSGEKQIFG